MRTVAPKLEEIDAELSALSELRDKPSGTVRITAAEHSAAAILWPALATLLPRFPDIKVEVNIDYGFTDILTKRFDAGVRLGEQVAKDMIAVRVGPDFCMAVVGTPCYFAIHPKPTKPQDLTAHRCISIRLPTYGGIYAREFEKRGRALKVRVEGPLVFNNMALRMNAVLAGLGLAYLPEDQVEAPIADGRLIRVLADWCAPFSGYHLYYPSRRQIAPAFALLVEAVIFALAPSKKRPRQRRGPLSWKGPSLTGADLHGFHAGFGLGLGLERAVVDDGRRRRGRLGIHHRAFLGGRIAHDIKFGGDRGFGDRRCGKNQRSDHQKFPQGVLLQFS
jgi:DNA-binding transcriptional LysR family regulator